MTREEAIEILKTHHMWTGEPQEIIDVRKENKALEMAIQALSQEPCEDAISREAVLSMQYRIDDSATLSTRDVVNVDDIESLPPVTQKPIECDDAVSQNQSNACSILDDECPYPYKHCWECPLHYQYELAKHELDKNVELPSVTQKSGKWILKRTFPTKLYDEHLNEYKCSECYREIRCTESQLVNYPYCHCGAKMESEDNEE